MSAFYRPDPPPPHLSPALADLYAQQQLDRQCGPLARLRAVVAERWPAAAVVCEDDESLVAFVAEKLGRVE